MPTRSGLSSLQTWLRLTGEGRPVNSQITLDGRVTSALDTTDALHGYAHGWPDGPPAAPSRTDRTAEFLSTTGRPPDELIGRLEQLRHKVTVEFAAISAEMAGCLPEQFPVVLAAWDALMLERAVVDGGWQITSGRAPLIVVNGPVRHRLGFNSDAVPPAASSANTAVARAIELIILNGYGIRPPSFEEPMHGNPGSWAVCLAENEEQSPWEPLSTDGELPLGTDGVSATLARSFHYVDDDTRDPERLLADVADTLTRTGSLIFGHAPAGIIFCPEHAQLLGGTGMTKRDVRCWLEREAYTPKDLMIMVAGARTENVSAVVRLVSDWSRFTARVEQRRTPEAKDVHP